MIQRSHGDQFDGETRRRFEIIRTNTQRMGRLIEDLLAFSRLGKQELTIVTVDIGGLVTGVWEELKAANPDKPMILKCGPLPPISGDRPLLRQVFTNLLSNAVKFARPRSEVIVEVGAQQGEAEIVYTIKDNGIGFDMTYYGKLFGMFQRLHRPEDFQGTGVGLAIAQRIVLRHHGRIWAESKIDGGACFYVALPKV
jgi:light-regulated signal transduction histidine kinase (bacteriophytochrome)